MCHSRATVDPNRERLSAPLERFTANPEPIDLQADRARLTPQTLVSNPGSGTSEAPSFRGFLRSGGRAPHPGGDLLPVETALGRAVAVAIVRFRAEHDL